MKTHPIRVLKGGGCVLPTPYLRASNRSWSGPSGRSHYLGFRLVRKG